MRLACGHYTCYNLSMHRVVPELIVENYRAGSYHGEFPAVGMFLDLSGFSTMTDVLMQHGQHGAEALAGLMHSVFDPLVESVFDYGGKIVGFAGDGIMALYPVEIDAHATALRALTSAYIIQKSLQEQPTRETIYGAFPISAKIGLASGLVTWGILRASNGEQATYYFRGDVVDESAEAEHQARAGDILLTEEVAALLMPAVDSVPGETFHRFREFRTELPEPRRLTLPPVDLEVSRLFMPEEVIAYDVRGEFRQIVNVFMRFPDLTEPQLQELMSRVFELRNQYGGLVSRLDFGDKGCNLLILLGAPVAYENDIGRALNFLLDLKAQVDFPITSGVTYYIAHAGYLGSAMCEDYTCYGWGVNLASRFMMSAPGGDIWVDDRIARRVSKRFDVEFIGSQHFKGFAAEQKVHRLRGRAHVLGPLYEGELVGREGELAQLADFIQPLWQNTSAGLALISGDAGVGKGRLVYEFRSSSMFAGRDILWAVCQSDQILRQSFNPLRSWLLTYFGMSSDQTAAERQRVFTKKMDGLIARIPDPELARELERTCSFLAALLDVHIPDSLYEQLDAEGRYNNTFLALIALLKAESLLQPVVLFLEDLQFTDPDSKEFLPRLKRALNASGVPFPVAIIVTTRPSGNLLAPEMIDARISLRGLSQESVGHLAETMLGGAAAPGLVARLWKRSEGNPYFVEQIIRYLLEENLLEMSAGGWSLVRRLREDFLPGDIRSVLVARLDQLAREVKLIIQTASVLGREFEVQVLSQMLRDDQNVPIYVAEAEKAAIWAPLNEIRYIFSHGLLRDAAYGMQMRARRRELHGLALESLERLYGDVAGRYAELAYHAEHAGLAAKAQKYYTMAGKVAATLYQNSQAADYYSRALSFSPPEDPAVRFDIVRERVELYALMGNRDLQWDDLDMLERWAAELGEPDRVAVALMLRAGYYLAIADFTNTITSADRAEQTSDRMANSELGLYTQLIWTVALMRLGRLDAAMQRARDTLERQRAAGNRKEEARILTTMGLIALEQKEPASAEQYLVDGLEIARQVMDLGLEARALNNLAMAEGALRGDYSRAHAYYAESYRIARQTGDRRAESIALGNLGFAAGMQGDFVTARSYYEQSLSLSRETGNRSMETYALINMSAVTALQNDPGLAAQYAQSAVDLAQKTADRSVEAWAWLYMGHAHLQQNEFDYAGAAYLQSLQLRESLGQLNLSMESLAGLVEMYLQTQQLEAAGSKAEQILSYIEGGGTLDGTDEPLRVYYACYLYLQETKDPRNREILERAVQLLEGQLSKLANDTARTRYVQGIPWRRAIWDLKHATHQP
jgi:class 3 adenylate cyclase/tetratricopeptide (TPR) repeat protein